VTPDRTWLIVGGVLSAIAALAHLAVIAGGPDWYRFFGAGEGMAQAAARGELRPALITVGIAAILFVWAAYAFSGAGLLPRLPLLRTALVAISAVYLLRAMAPIPVLLFRPGLAGPFLWWSSGIVLVYALFYAIGTHAAWPRLSGAGQAL
jgi:hypothetical protein